MFRMIDKMPEDFLSRDSVCSPDWVIEAFNDDGPYCYIVLEGTPVGHTIHFDVRRFSVEVYKDMLEYWPRLLTALKTLGVKSLHAAYPPDRPKSLDKLIVGIGFTEPVQFKYASMEV